jgi:ABC-type bacteriocin/lantibiotic exporter with double-glycine peptidase domain
VSTNFKNNNSTSPLKILKRIGAYLSIQRKKELIFVLILSIFSSLAESISIAALVPFISFFINAESYLFNSLFKTIFEYLNISSKKEILGLVSSFFILLILISGYIKTKYIKLSNQVTEKITSDFRINIFNFLITQDFSYHFKHGSNEIMSNLSQKTGSFTTLIFSSINILNSILISASIFLVLVLNEPFYTPVILSSIVMFFFIIFKIKSNTVLKEGQKVNLKQNFIIDVFENTVGYLPEVTIYNLRKFYSSILSRASKETASASAHIRTIGQIPRIYLETFVIIFVVIFIYFSGFSERTIETNISYLAILAFGAQKSLPLINSIYNLSVNFKGSTPIVSTFLNILESGNENIIEDKNYKSLSFSKSIIMEKVSFQYNKNLPKVLKNINFEIKKGEKVAIKGDTGSGKSTLANIITALFYPSSGKLLIDNIEINSENKMNWQKNISIVPQTIFLNNASILENIAIAVKLDEIDVVKAKNCASLANISSFIEKLPNQYNEKVGERGVRLSGGQRQRIGVARALYRDASLIILDEPTNALDLETENLVMNSLSNLKKDITVIMISHSNNSLKYFDKIIDLNKFK